MPLFRLLITLIVFSFTAHAKTATYDVNSVEPGGLYFATEKIGRVVRAPTLSADVDMVINGPIVRTRVTQYFVNTSDAWLEGLYTYPLPKGSAVDVLQMQVGDRLILGEIQEKEKAQKTYNEARDAGKRASLVVQSRPNIFSTRLANIGPGETVQISIEYQDLIEPRDNVFQLRFPMVVRPRYVPGIPLDDRQARLGWGFDTDEVPDGSAITQPLAIGRQAQNPVSMSISLNPGFEMASLESPSHDIAVEQNARSATVTLADGDVPADQDFILRWTPVANSAPQVGLFEEEIDQGNFQLLMLLPPTETAAKQATPARELVIVLDRSGSMSGQAIRQAKAAVRRAVLRLSDRDTFNVIAFSDRAKLLFPGSQPVTDRTIDAALDFVSNIEANGGTEMSPALAYALSNQALDQGERLKQVIFVTDGAVGNEATLMAQIKADLGSARLFTVGIGSAPNNYFMSEAAHFGRGTFINIAMQDDVMNAMAELFRKIERPQLTDLQVEGLPEGADIVPTAIPDLYDGEPIVIAVKGANTNAITVVGERNGEPWTMTVPQRQGGSAEGVAALWARKKIGTINRSFIGQYGRDAQNDRRAQVLKVALAHHLVSDFTSLVAVEQEPVRPPEETIFKREVAANLPAGMDWGAQKRMTISKGLITAEAAQHLAVQARATATPSALYLIIGLGMLMISLLLWMFSRREELKPV